MHEPEPTTVGAPRRPAIAGVAQVANKDDERIVHPVELLDQAARAALDDAGVKLDAVGAVFATPLSSFGSATTSRAVAEHLGLPAGQRIDGSYSGAAPQRLLAAACRAVADGTVEAALVVGGIADASVRRARARGIAPPAPATAVWSQGSDGVAEGLQRMAESSRGLADRWPGHLAEVAAGALMPSAYFALVESVLAGDVTPVQHRRQLACLLAPFTEAAARRPDVAWFPTVREPAEIAEPTAANRLVAEPYTKLMCSFPTVDLAAAVVVTADASSFGASSFGASSFGASAGGGHRSAIRPLSLAAAREARPPSGRRHLDRSVALDRAVATALQLASADVEQVSLFDLYSCFPAAVQMTSRSLGLDPDDPRPRTVSGGLPYFGGPGASYSLHGLVCMVEELRARPGSLGVVVGVGGMIDDFSVGVYGTADTEFASVDLGRFDEHPTEVAVRHDGPAVVEAMTVLHDRHRGPVAAPVIARLPDGRRIGARPADPTLAAALSGTSLVGRAVTIATVDDTAAFALD